VHACVCATERLQVPGVGMSTLRDWPLCQDPLAGKRGYWPVNVGVLEENMRGARALTAGGKLTSWFLGRAQRWSEAELVFGSSRRLRWPLLKLKGLPAVFFACFPSPVTVRRWAWVPVCACVCVCVCVCVAYSCSCFS
jgi:hypothetical protein